MAQDNNNNKEKKNDNKKRYALLAGIVGLAILSLFVLLSNPGLLVPPNADEDNNQAEATPNDDNSDTTDEQEQVMTDEIKVSDNMTIVNNTSSGSVDDGNGGDKSAGGNGGSGSNDDNSNTTPEVPDGNNNNNNNTGGGGNNGGGDNNVESDDDNDGHCNRCENQSPVADDISVNTDEDTSLMINFMASVTDSNDDELTISIITQPEHGEVKLNDDGTAMYAPDIDYFGSDSFTYMANDGRKDSNIATVTITINSVIIVHMDDRSRSYGFELYSGRQLYAEYVTPDSSLVGKQIDTIVLELSKRGNPVGTAEIGVFNSDLTLKRSFGTIDVSTITSTYLLPTEYTFTFPYSEELYTIEAGDRIGIKFDDGTVNDSVIVKVDDDPSDPFDGRNSYRTFHTITWINVLDGDLWMRLINSR